MLGDVRVCLADTDQGVRGRTPLITAHLSIDQLSRRISRSRTPRAVFLKEEDLSASPVLPKKRSTALNVQGTTPNPRSALKLRIFPPSGSDRSASPIHRGLRAGCSKDLLRSPATVMVLSPQLMTTAVRTPTVTPSRQRKWSASCPDTRDTFTPLPTPPPREQITVLKTLGSGGFGSVYLGEWAGRKVAVKTLHACTKNKDARFESFRAELLTLGLKHPNVVRTLTACGREFADGTYLIMEYAGDQNLLQIIDNPDELLNVERRLRYSLDLARALAFIHRKNLAHLDVKPANVIVSPGDVCKLGDFGCCQAVDEETGVSCNQVSSLTGTVSYRAPEVLRGEIPSIRADVYSYAITLWQMLARETPYPGEAQHVVIFGVVAYGRRPCPSDPVPCTDDPAESMYAELFKQCWHRNPDTRPTAEEICSLIDHVSTTMPI